VTDVHRELLVAIQATTDSGNAFFAHWLHERSAATDLNDWTELRHTEGRVDFSNRRMLEVDVGRRDRRSATTEIVEDAAVYESRGHGRWWYRRLTKHPVGRPPGDPRGLDVLRRVAESGICLGTDADVDRGEVSRWCFQWRKTNLLTDLPFPLPIGVAHRLDAAEDATVTLVRSASGLVESVVFDLLLRGPGFESSRAGGALRLVMDFRDHGQAGEVLPPPRSTVRRRLWSRSRE
jgi:hypothetical protein